MDNIKLYLRWMMSEPIGDTMFKVKIKVKVEGKVKVSTDKDTTPSKDYDLQFMLLGTVQHAAYHAGQIAVLKRAKS